jgi:hypothetical protein
MKIENIPVDRLIPYARNSRTHSDEQVAQIAASIREFGFTNPVLIDGNDGIIAGHGRVLGARKLGMDAVPCVRLEHLTETQKRAYIIADNKLALNAGWDDEMLALEFEELRGEDFDLSLIGFDAGELAELMGGAQDGEYEEHPDGLDDKYSKKIKVPIYEITGKNPETSELLDDTKTSQLIENIRAAVLPADITEFLIHAAQRHTRFHFRQIAERYAHSDKATQELFEQSGLVIIDFDKAIENGFVSLSAQLGVLADKEMAGADDEG